jgi:Tol biopolymer transport system component
MRATLVGGRLSKTPTPTPAMVIALLAAVLAALLLSLVEVEKPASAAFPGANGKIAFHSDRDGDSEIYTMNADGTGVVKLTDNVANDYVPTFSPDGTKIVFTSDRDGDSDEIYTMNADGTGVVRLTNNSEIDDLPSFSPDGKRIAYYGYDGQDYEIYTINADGTNQTGITNNMSDDADPVYSPDGTRIAFVSSRDGCCDMYTMNADGTSPTRITSDGSVGVEGGPDFSPGGTRIAFHRSRDDGCCDVFTMNVDGTDLTRLTDDGSSAYPHFSPDGTKIAFTSAQEVYAMNDDGTNRINLTNSPSFDAWSSWQPVKYAFGSGSGGSFGEPVRDTELNRLAAGASVPVKFGLGGDYGLNIFAAGYPASKQVSCPMGLPPDNVEETATVSKSGLAYDATSGLYTYVWKTDRTWRGTCRELNLKLADGSDHRVQFQFT